MKLSEIVSFYNDIKNGGSIFVGRAISAESFCYCVKNEVTFESIIENCSEINILSGKKYVFETYDEMLKAYEEGKDYILLKELAQIIDYAACPSLADLLNGSRKLAFWGCGKTLKYEWDIISERISPTVIFDREKTGKYNGIPIEKFDAEKHRPEEYFVVITNQKYKEEVSESLKKKGFTCGRDFMSDTQYINSSLSAMFMKAIQAKPLFPIKCSRPFSYVNVGEHGELTHCCYAWLPYYVGNICNIENGVLESGISRIIKLSFLNHSYCFCNKELCYELHHTLRKEDTQDKNHLDKEPVLHIETADMAFDRSCNLYCRSCRNTVEVCGTEENMCISEAVLQKLMPYLRHITVAGNGEVFLSKPYQAILSSGEYKNTDLSILSNGNMFSKEFVENILNNYKSVSLMFSVDAGSKKVYERTRRGGNWDRLLENLWTVSRLREDGKIKMFILRFVVSMDNAEDIPAFINLGKSLKADAVDFSKIENWGTFTQEEFDKVCIEKDGKYKKELEDILALPIMKAPIVRLLNI